jgi:hypothetical protein
MLKLIIKFKNFKYKIFKGKPNLLKILLMIKIILKIKLKNSQIMILILINNYNKLIKKYIILLLSQINRLIIHMIKING